MPLQTCASYRGYSINMQVIPARRLSFSRCRASTQSVVDHGDAGKTTASFPERFEFVSDCEAFKYAENRAFIDCMLPEGTACLLRAKSCTVRSARLIRAGKAYRPVHRQP